MKIEIDGEKYQVTENLGFVHDRNEYAKAVMTEHGEKIVVRSPYAGSLWKFAKPIVLLTKGRRICGQEGEQP